MALSTMMLRDACEYMRPGRGGDLAVLVSGNGSFAETVRAIRQLGVRTRVVGWLHSTNAELRAAADEFVALDSYFGDLGRGSGALKAA